MEQYFYFLLCGGLVASIAAILTGLAMWKDHDEPPWKLFHTSGNK